MRTDDLRDDAEAASKVPAAPGGTAAQAVQIHAEGVRFGRSLGECGDRRRDERDGEDERSHGWFPVRVVAKCHRDIAGAA